MVLGTNNYKVNIMDKPYDFWPLQTSWVIVDLGAHVGEYTFEIYNKVKEVWAIEPTPEAVKFLKKEIKEKGITNIFVQEFAINDEDGRRMFNLHHDKDSDGNSFYKNRGPPPKETIEVKTKTWDSFMKENNINHIDLVLVDIEGAEREFFNGMTILPERIFISAYHGRWMKEALSKDEILQELVKKGYKIVQDKEINGYEHLWAELQNVRFAELSKQR